MNAEAHRSNPILSATARQAAIVVVVFVAIGLAAAYLLRDLRFDDPFITYRYAENLASGHGFRFNPDEATLITTAPLYALILTLLRVTGIDIATASNRIGAIALVVAAITLYALDRRARARAKAGFVAGLCFLVFPLVWLTLGFETPLFLAAALLTFAAVDARRPVLAGIGAGIAMGLRGDGLIVLAVAALFAVDTTTWQRAVRGFGDLRRMALGFARPVVLALVGVALYAPLAIWLTAQFGSPLPTTLQTKAAQAVSGLTGFYPYTTFIEGAWLVLRALLTASPGSLILFVLALAGAVYLWRARFRCVARGLLMPIVWAIVHLAGYSVLRVAPYVWYYAPIVPGIACLAGLGVEWLGDFAQRRAGLRLLPMIVTIGVIGTLLVADVPIVAVLQGAVPPSPDDLRSKLLPETKVDIYRTVGQWLHDHTPVDATLGVTELGVMSYYAQRHTADFLGLTQPQYLDAIRHGDYMQTLVREQPDYVALSNINAVYDFDPQQDAWFTATYTRVMSFEDTRFWGSPMSVWQRVRAAPTTWVTLDRTAHDLGGGWQIMEIAASSRIILGGEPLWLRLHLQAGQPVGNRTLSVQPVVLEGGDGLPVSSRIIFTNQWHTGEQGWVDVPIMPQLQPRRGGYAVEARWLEGGPTVRAGTLKVALVAVPHDGAPVAALSSDVAVELIPQSITVCIGASVPVTLYWRGGVALGVDYTAFVQVRNGSAVVVQADGPPRNGTYPTSIWTPGELIPDPHLLHVDTSTVAGTYPLVVGLYNSGDNTRMPVSPSPFRTPDGGVQVAQVIVRKCG